MQSANKTRYVMDLYKLCAITSEHDAKKSGAEVVKQSASAPISGLIYPLMQCLDEVGWSDYVMCYTSRV